MAAAGARFLPDELSPPKAGAGSGAAGVFGDDPPHLPRGAAAAFEDRGVDIHSGEKGGGEDDGASSSAPRLIFAGEKTPIPTNASQINAAMLGTSWQVEMPREICPCGRPIGPLFVELMFRLADVPQARQFEEFDKFATEKGFKDCDRNTFLSPMMRNVICSDIGSTFVSLNVPEGVMRQGRAPVPVPATTFSEAALPPPLVSWSKRMI
jgi:hypothetical protein